MPGSSILSGGEQQSWEVQAGESETLTITAFPATS